MICIFSSCWSYYLQLPPLLGPHLSFLVSTLSLLVSLEWEGTNKRHFDAQVSKKVQYSVVRVL